MKNSITLLIAACVVAACGDKSPGAPEATLAAAPAPAAQPAPPPPPPPPKKWDGPLGVEMGLSVDQLEKAGVILKEIEPGVYSSDTTPAPNGNFESYTYLINEKTGLCKVIAIGGDIQANAFGDQVKSVFDELEPALTAKYGKPSDVFKFLQAGSIWKGNEYWMMGLAKKERMHTVLWMNGSKGVKLEGLGGIALKAAATNSSNGYVTLSYEFPNIDECLEVRKKKANESL